MRELKDSFILLKDALTEDDLTFLKESCKTQLETENMPCFALLNQLHSSCYLKIRRLVQDAIGENANYLNDFYLYTDSSSIADWHMIYRRLAHGY